MSKLQPSLDTLRHAKDDPELLRSIVDDGARDELLRLAMKWGDVQEAAVLFRYAVDLHGHVDGMTATRILMTLVQIGAWVRNYGKQADHALAKLVEVAKTMPELHVYADVIALAYVRMGSPVALAWLLQWHTSPALVDRCIEQAIELRDEACLDILMYKRRRLLSTQLIERCLAHESMVRWLVRHCWRNIDTKASRHTLCLVINGAINGGHARLLEREIRRVDDTQARLAFVQHAVDAGQTTAWICICSWASDAERQSMAKNTKSPVVLKWIQSKARDSKPVRNVR